MPYNPNLPTPYYAFVCTECHSDQNIDPFRNVWVQENQMPPCKWCGGVVGYIEGQTEDDMRRARQHALEDVDARRLGVAPDADL